MSVHKPLIKLIAFILIAVLAGYSVALVARAQITGGPIGSPSFWQKIGNILSPIDDSNTQVNINDLTVGTISIDAIAYGSIITGYIQATSTTATSTFAGGFTVDSTDFVVDPDAGRVGIGTANPNSKLSVNGVTESGTGTAGYGYVFTGDTDTGLYYVGANNFNLLAGGTTVVSISNGSIAGANVATYLKTGSASAPTYSFNSDTNTGMFSGGADIIGFTTGATEKMRIDPSGNVGIGTTSPLVKLHVQSTTGDVFSIIDRANSSSAGRLKFATASSDEFEIGLKGGVAGFHIADGSVNELMTVLSSGNVGIGDVSPDLKLHVNSGATQRSLKLETTASSGKQIVFRDSATTGDTSVMIGSTGDAMSFYAGSSGLEFLTIDSAGDLGVGTTSPPHALTLGTAGDLINFGNGMCMGQDSGTTTPNVTIQNCSDF